MHLLGYYLLNLAGQSPRQSLRMRVWQVQAGLVGFVGTQHKHELSLFNLGLLQRNFSTD